MPTTAVLPELAPDDVAAVLALVAAADAADGGEQVSEDARLALPAPARPGLLHVLLRGDAGELLGYAQAAAPARAGGGAPGGAAGVTGELVVAPAARGRGLGALLAESTESAARALGPGPRRAWSHADSPAAAAIAARRGYRRARELWRMSRPLGDGAPALPALVVPDAVRLRTFEVGRDEQAWLALNARAFASHPEQGRWTLGDLRTRQAEPWYDPTGVVLAEDAADGRLLAAHWTKEPGDGTGEVYVVGVDPSAQGRGLGPLVVLAGLHLLTARGHRLVRLYVEGDNAAAQRVYTRLGFTHDGSDVLYER